MRRRTVLALSGLSAGALGGCLSGLVGCRGVELAVRLHPPESTTDESVLDLDELDLTDHQRSLLEEATSGQLVTCTRHANERDTALQRLIETVAEAAGYDHGDLYYSDQRVRFPVRYDGRRYQAELVFDTAESAGGPL